MTLHPTHIFIAEEEQKLKELQLDYSEKVAVVEALKLELRQTTNGELGKHRFLGDVTGWSLKLLGGLCNMTHVPSYDGGVCSAGKGTVA